MNENNETFVYGDTYTNNFDECLKFVLSKDRKSILYTMILNEKHYLYLNDKELKKSDEIISNLKFSDDGKNYTGIVDEYRMMYMEGDNIVLKERIKK